MSRVVHALGVGVAAALCFGLPLAGASASAPGEDSFDYLYIESNEGGSSGGHTGIRFGLETYHFQNRDGLLVLDRERTHDFVHAYALVNNRTIQASRVALDTSDAERLRGTFDRRYHAQTRQLDTAAALAEDRALLEAWRDPSLTSPPVPALGYFVASGAESQAVAALRERILAHYGADVLVDRRAWAMDRLSRVASLDPAAWPAPPPEGRYDDPPFAYPWARSYLDAAGGVGAVEVLEAAAPLDDSALVVLGGPGGQLEDSEMLRLRASREELEAGLVRLVGSMRPDWGRPFLVGLARLLALDEALVRGRLVVLAVLPEDGRRLEHRVLAERQALLEEMIAVGREQVELARRAWLEGAATDELQQARLEETINRVDELERAMRERRDLRLAHGQLLPSRPGRTRTHLPRIEAPSRVDAHLERVAARQKRHRAGMKELYRYHLTARNCVSELFLTLNDGLGGSKASSELALGGYVDGRRDLTFVPFVSAQAVGREYRVIDRRVVPSHRELRLAEMRREESALRVALRESNTLTARSYRRAHRDSYFLLFTDDSVLPRPIFGAVNLAAAGLESVWGLARLPLDGGHTLVSGLEGALLSLPELAFFNIRKGSNDWVAPRPPLLDD